MPDAIPSSATEAHTIQSLCAQGQAHLLTTNYLAAERVLMQAEAMAWADQDWDALARLYMPLQEARRQRRQRSLDGEFFCQLDVDPTVVATADQIAQGQVLIPGDVSIAPSIALRKQAAAESRYIDVFLSAAYRVGDDYAVVILPTDAIAVPASVNSIDTLLRRCPPHSVVLLFNEIPASRKVGDAATGAFAMDLWERLHRPFLALADACTEPVQRIAAYRDAIVVDYACELAHQKLSQTARELARQAKQNVVRPV